MEEGRNPLRHRNAELNDGVRMNIRPFIEAGILRKKPYINGNRDRCKEPQRPKEEYPWPRDGGTFKGDRANDRHYRNDEKWAAAEKMKHTSTSRRRVDEEQFHGTEVARSDRGT